jgi:hypothetical protein
MELVIDTIVHMQEDQKRKAQMTKPLGFGYLRVPKAGDSEGRKLFLCETPVKPYHYSVRKILV